jgi:hypothetical protein
MIQQWNDYLYSSLVFLKGKYGSTNEFTAADARKAVSEIDKRTLMSQMPLSNYTVSIDWGNSSVADVMEGLRKATVAVLRSEMITDTQLYLLEGGMGLQEKYGYHFDDTIINSVFHGLTWEDRIIKHSAQLDRDMDAIIYAVLYVGLNISQAYKRMNDRFAAYQSKIENINMTETTRIEAEYIKLNVPASTKFRFIANGNACSKCEPYDEQVFTVAQVMQVLPVHSSCRCSLEIISQP